MSCMHQEIFSLVPAELQKAASKLQWRFTTQCAIFSMSSSKARCTKVVISSEALQFTSANLRKIPHTNDQPFDFKNNHGNLLTTRHKSHLSTGASKLPVPLDPIHWLAFIRFISSNSLWPLSNSLVINHLPNHQASDSLAPPLTTP